MIQVQQHGSVTAIRMARTFLGRPLYWTTAYWLDGVLIDTGPAYLAQELLRVLANRHIDQILVTHAHEDHIGGLHLLHRRFPAAHIYASPQAIEIIQDPSRLHPQLYRRLLWGVPKAVTEIRPLPLQVKTPQFCLRVIETPGHSPDHVSFYEPTHRWLFTGDAFIGGKDQSWANEYEMFGIVSSLRALAALRPERIFPGSGNVRRTAQPELHGKIAQLLGLCQEVARLDAKKFSTEEIVEQLFEGESRMRFWTQGHFSGAHLVEACRRYNDIFDPATLADDVSISATDEDDVGDSSTSESADQNDWRSTK